MAGISRVHETTETVAVLEFTPPHPPRTETPEYRQTHDLLVLEKDTPCKGCGVRHSDLQDERRRADPAINRYGATQIETHHYPVERSLLDAVDWRKVHNDFPEVYNQHSLEVWVDSPRNMLVLCDICHRSPTRGIHHLLTQDFAILPYLLDGYQIAARPGAEATAALATDERIEHESGIEQQVDAQVGHLAAIPATSPASPKQPASLTAHLRRRLSHHIERVQQRRSA